VPATSTHRSWSSEARSRSLSQVPLSSGHPSVARRRGAPPRGLPRGASKEDLKMIKRKSPVRSMWDAVSRETERRAFAAAESGSMGSVNLLLDAAIMEVMRC
jgi:hypothetical protein